MNQVWRIGARLELNTKSRQIFGVLKKWRRPRGGGWGCISKPCWASIWWLAVWYWSQLTQALHTRFQIFKYSRSLLLNTEWGKATSSNNIWVQFPDVSLLANNKYRPTGTKLPKKLGVPSRTKSAVFWTLFKRGGFKPMFKILLQMLYNSEGLLAAWNCHKKT